MPLKIDLGKKGFNMVLKPYQVEAMRFLWTRTETGASSKDVYDAVNERLGTDKSISRASIINSLNALVDDGILDYHEITGKGGHRRIYKPFVDEPGLKQLIADRALNKLLEEFPQETRKILT